MTVIDAIVLGFTQGATEFIPVSSSGHLTLLQYLMGGANDHLFIEFINIGTLLALLVFFRKKVLEIIVELFVRKNYRLARNILITAIPAGVAGLLLADVIEQAGFFGSVVTVAAALGVVGIVMILVEKLPRMSSVKSGEKLPWTRALFIGLVQTLALIPGVSRSASTMIAGRVSGLKPGEAAEYSFLVSIPIMCGVTFKMLVGSGGRVYLHENLGTLLLSNAVAFVVGLAAIGFLMKYLQKERSLQLFGWYRVVLAIVLLIMFLL